MQNENEKNSCSISYNSEKVIPEEEIEQISQKQKENIIFMGQGYYIPDTGWYISDTPYPALKKPGSKEKKREEFPRRYGEPTPMMPSVVKLNVTIDSLLDTRPIRPNFTLRGVYNYKNFILRF